MSNDRVRDPISLQYSLRTELSGAAMSWMEAANSSSFRLARPGYWTARSSASFALHHAMSGEGAKRAPVPSVENYE